MDGGIGASNPQTLTLTLYEADPSRTSISTSVVALSALTVPCDSYTYKRINVITSRLQAYVSLSMTSQSQ